MFNYAKFFKIKALQCLIFVLYYVMSTLVRLWMEQTKSLCNNSGLAHATTKICFDIHLTHYNITKMMSNTNAKSSMGVTFSSLKVTS